MIRFGLTLALCCAAAPAQAQPLFGGRLPTPQEVADLVPPSGTSIHFVLLQQKSVEQELKLTPDQVQRAQDVGEKQLKQLQGIRSLPREEAAQKLVEAHQTADKELQTVLSPEQFARLRQIGLQQMGPMTLGRPDVADAVGLTPEQRQKIRELHEQLIQSAMKGMQSDATGRAKLREIRAKISGLQDTIARVKAEKKETEAKVLELLTDEQKAKWASEQGPRFEGELSLGPFARRP
jgi:Spy/CpxP family protein refolding chaperone